MKQYVIREERLTHKDRRNISEVEYWGPFDDEKSAEEYAKTITGKIVTVCEVTKPTAQ